MITAMKELQKLQGVGEILSKRFIEAGYDTFSKIAAAGEEGLRKIPGVNPRVLRSIVAQAAAMETAPSRNRTEKTKQLKLRVSAMEEKVQEIALSMHDRFKDELSGKPGKRLQKQIVKLICALERVELKLETKVKKAGKTLLKAEGKLEGLTMSGLKKIGRQLRKTRKTLKPLAG